MKFLFCNNTRKVLTVLSIVLVCCLLSFGCAACVDPQTPEEIPTEEEQKVSLFNVKSSENGCVITGLTQSFVGDTLDIPETIDGTSVVGIGNNAFADNFSGKNIKTVNFPKTVKIIGENAFYKCDLLETVNFASDSVLAEIGPNAFSESGIKKITIPETVTYMGHYAFFKCDNLTEIGLSKTFTYFGAGAFGYNKFTQVNLTSDSDFVVENGILYNRAKTEIITLLGGLDVSEFTMPDSVETVGSYAFAGSSLSRIKMSNGIHIIDCGAFENCKELESIYLPSTLRNMGYDAFKGCEKLSYVRFESEVVPGFGWGMFDGNAEGRKIYVPGLAKQDYLYDERLQAYRSDITTIVSKIYFNTNGGEEIEPMDAEYNKGITLPTPVKSGCEFLGWYFDEEFKNKFASSRWYKDSDTTLYAKWQVLL